MKLYWSPQTRSTRALWMLEEAGLDYERERVDIQNPDRRNSAEFLDASPTPRRSGPRLAIAVREPLLQSRAPPCRRRPGPHPL
jgi:hypothetical protein